MMAKHVDIYTIDSQNTTMQPEIKQRNPMQTVVGQNITVNTTLAAKNLELGSKQWVELRSLMRDNKGIENKFEK